MEADRKRKRPAEDWEGKRRRRVGGDVGKPCGGADEAAVAGRPAVEDEVEEFFAIVRRMHAAARQFSAGGSSRGSGMTAAVGGGMTAAGGGQVVRGDGEEGKGFYRWRPSFTWEDFEEGGSRKLPDTSGDGGYGRRGEVAPATSAPIAAVGRVGQRQERAAENGIAVCLDLNAEPEPERVLG